MLRTIIALLALLLATPLSARVIGTYDNGKVFATIHSEQGNCPEGSARATISLEPGKTIEGCYIRVDDTLVFVWETGAVGRAPAKAFKRSDV